jgi:PII-like signaling protein
MHPRLRLELIIERMALQRACTILESAGLTGYTVLPAIAGFGGGNRWNRDTDISAAGNMLVIISIGTQARVEAALEKIEQLLGRHIGVLNVSEVKVLRPERF